MRQPLFTFILLLVFTIAQAQIKKKYISRDKLKKDFIADSLGCSGLRLSYIDSTKKIYKCYPGEKRKKILVNGISLLKEKEDKLELLLGKSNEFSRRRSENVREGWVIVDDTYTYYLSVCESGKKWKVLVINAQNGIIYSVRAAEK